MLARATPGSASFGGNGRSEGPFGAALRLARTHVASRSRGRFVWVTGVEQHETVSRRVVGWLRWQAHRMRSAATQRGSFRWRGVLWGVMACYAVVVAGLSAYLLLKAFALLSTAGLAAAEVAAAVTASAAAVTALATIALVWTAVHQAAETMKRAAPVSMRLYTKWTKQPHLVAGIIHPGSEGNRPIRELYRGPSDERGCIALEFINAGALTESVEEIKVVLGNGAEIPYGGDGDSPPCPFEIPPRGSFTVLLDAHATYYLAAFDIQSIPGSRKAQVMARLGSGVTLRSEKVPLKFLQHEERYIPVPRSTEEAPSREEQPAAGD